MNADEKFRTMYAMDGDVIELEVIRTTIEEGRTFSGEALHDLVDSMECWVTTRLIRRWDTTGEPPTVCKVTIKVDVQ